MEVQKCLKPRCFHLSPTPNPLAPSQCPKSPFLRLIKCGTDLGSAASREETDGLSDFPTIWQERKRWQTDIGNAYLFPMRNIGTKRNQFIYKIITKYSNSERIVSVSRLVEAALSLRKNPSLGDRIVVELIGDSFPKFEESAHSVCPKTFCCYYDGQKTR